MSLARVLGTWSFTMQHVAMPEPVTGQQQYERVLEDAFIMLRSRYAHPAFPDAIALMDEHTCHYFDVRGVSRVFDLELSEAGWTMVRRDPDFWQRSSVRFLGPDAMDGTGENSHDGGITWKHDFSISYNRIT